MGGSRGGLRHSGDVSLAQPSVLCPEDVCEADGPGQSLSLPRGELGVWQSHGREEGIREGLWPLTWGCRAQGSPRANKMASGLVRCNQAKRGLQGLALAVPGRSLGHQFLEGGTHRPGPPPGGLSSCRCRSCSQSRGPLAMALCWCWLQLVCGERDS